MQLRPYQSELIEDIRSSLMAGHRAVCAVLGCGGGKSVIQAAIAKSATQRGNRVLYLIHRHELQDQIRATFTNYGVDMDLCDVSMVQTASRRLAKLPDYQLIITDECFTSDTIVGGKPLTELHIGDIIASYSSKGIIEGKRITHIFKRIPSNLMSIKFSDGTNIKCTKNHPIFIDGIGYIPASEIKEGYYAAKVLLYNVWKGNRPFKIHKKPGKIQAQQIQKRRSYLLLQGMRNGIHRESIKFCNDGNEQENCKAKQRENEEKQSDERPCYTCKGFKEAEGNWPLPKDQVRERMWIDCASAKNASFFVRKISKNRICRICNTNKIRTSVQNKIPRLLQSRYCDSRRNACNRNRRVKSQLSGKKGTRCEKRVLLKYVRVESTEVYEQTSDGTFGGMCPDGFFYNFEVEDNHNYFANGILVHNCHHSTAATYRKIYDHYPETIRLGVTATPIRLNRGGLGEVYDDLIESVSTRWLIDHHYLAPYRYFSIPLVETAGLHTERGEYKASEVAALMEQKAIFGDTVRQWERIARGRKTIVYCASVDAARSTAEEFQTAGYSAAALDGTTPEAQRAATMAAFREGEITVLCNCELFGEGLDVPDCECVVLLRPTQSLTLHIQQSMRSMRYMPDKTALIIDHVGNCRRHGLPDDRREWSLAPKKQQENTVKIRECPNCYAVYPPTLSRCPYCGYMATHEIRTVNRQTVDVDLIEVQHQEEIRNTKLRDADLHTWEEIVEFQKIHKYKFAWCLRYAIAHEIEYPNKYRYMVHRFIK